jgi:uncharacterized SAM-binding protein YcdF (DUF218 family)
MAKNQNELNLPYRLVRTSLRMLIQLLGLVTLLMLVLALTPLPWKAYGWLSRAGEKLVDSPDVIVMMGGGGIPSESGLSRCYEVAVQARRHPKARVVVAMPLEPEETNGLSRVLGELAFRGVERSRLGQEGRGRHTREQALEVWKMLDGAHRQPSVMVVSSPEHIRRSAKAFRKAGFKKVGGAAAFGQALKANVTLPHEGALPDPAQSVLFRYRFWDNLMVQVRVLREFTALAYYRAKGWI